jgi:prepilin-type N-terminal cleavage/methylation domain-containing protein
MKNRKGFTLIELMVVILIVAILGALATSIIRGPAGAAKWSEGKAVMGTIATALRVHIVKKGSDFTPTPTLTQLGFLSTDLDCTYFTGGESEEGNFSWVINNNNPIDFLITATAPLGISPRVITLNHLGEYVENPVIKEAEKAEKAE